MIDFVHRRRSRTLNLAAFASMLAHAGLGVTLLGVTGISMWRTEALDVLAPGQTLQAAQYTLRFDGVEEIAGPNYDAIRARIVAMKDGAVVAVLLPEKRSYPAEGQEVADTAIRTNGVSDLYVALGDDRGGGKWVIRAYVNPLAPFIWFGGAIMALGGLTSLWSRLRLRVARPAPEAVAGRMIRALSSRCCLQRRSSPRRGRRNSPILRRKHARKRCRRSSAASSAKGSHWTSPMRNSPPTCAA